MSSAASGSSGQGAAALVGALGALIAADVCSCNRDQLGELVGRSQRLRGFLDAFDVKVAARARDLAAGGASESPDDVVSNRGRRSKRDAGKASSRAQACAVVPGLTEALEAGAVSGEHVDAVANMAAALDDGAKTELGKLADQVIGSATALPVEQFERECRDLGRILSGDGGRSQRQRNRHDRKVRRWVDRQSGMCKTLIELDAEADARMWAAINAAAGDARRDQSPDDDRTFDQVQADTVVDLITGARSVDRRVAEVSVLIDISSLVHGGHYATTCETANGEPLDVDTVRRLGCDGDLVGILLDQFGHCLAVGRANRLATREQRQALRAMYRTCAFPGCEVRFDSCRIHHVTWWERGGVTDLDNLIPLCSVHHHLVHEGGWTLTLEPDRTVTVLRPDGTGHFRGDTTDRRGARANRGQSPPRRRCTDDTGAVAADVANDLSDALDALLARSTGRPPP
jgi:hypothetical protein